MGKLKIVLMFGVWENVFGCYLSGNLVFFEVLLGYFLKKNINFCME